MTDLPCRRCGTRSGGLRIARLCFWCYAVTHDRPDDVHTAFGTIEEVEAEPVLRDELECRMKKEACGEREYRRALKRAARDDSLKFSMKTARRTWNTFDHDLFYASLRAVRDRGETARLQRVEGIGPVRASDLVEWYAEHVGIPDEPPTATEGDV